MDVVEYVKQRNRMCDYYVNCNDCPAGYYEGCSSLNGISKLVPIVEQWAKEHSVKTRQSEFLKQWPDAEMFEDGYLNICPALISKDYRDKGTEECYNVKLDCNVCKHDFWLKEI